MRVLFIDDEPNAHVNFRHDVEGRSDISSLHCFFHASDALFYAANNAVDCAFIDISLSGDMNGLDFAKTLKVLQPNVEVAFLTAYDDYTKASYQLFWCLVETAIASM